MPKTEADKVAGWIKRAFDYHPYGLREPRRLEAWVVGPTFIVLAPEYQVGDFSEGNERGAFSDIPLWQDKVTKYINTRSDKAPQVSVDKAKHEQSQQTKKDKWGAIIPFGPTSCSFRAVRSKDLALAELAYPLYSLAKALQVSHYRLGAGQKRKLYGFGNDDSLLAILATKTLGELCKP